MWLSLGYDLVLVQLGDTADRTSTLSNLLDDDNIVIYHDSDNPALIFQPNSFIHSPYNIIILFLLFVIWTEVEARFKDEFQPELELFMNL